MNSTSIAVYSARTSPSTLSADLDRVLVAGGIKSLSADRPTVVKINGNFDKIYPGSNTSKWFLRSLLGILRDRRFRRLSVIEGDLPDFRAEQMIKKTGLIEILDHFGVPFVPYERLPRDPHELPLLLGDAQLINVPVIHAHGKAVMSCATKNLFGLLPKTRRRYHPVLSEKLLELASLTAPFTVVDGTVGLDGESTRRGNPRRMDLLLSGWNLLTIDTVVARIIGYAPSEIPLLALAAERGLLPAEIPLRGDFSWENLPSHDFHFRVSGIYSASTCLEYSALGSLPAYLWVADRLRRLYHHYSYYRKRSQLFSGEWMEYGRID